MTHNTCLIMNTAGRMGGITLVETLAVLATAGVILMYAVPGLQQVLANDRQTSVVNRFVASALLARSIAATANTQAVMCPSEDGVVCSESSEWSMGWIVQRGPSSVRGEPELNLFHTVRQEQPTRPVVLHVNRAVFRFRPNGQRATNGTATFCTPHATHPRAVIISYNGRPRTSSRLPGGGLISCAHAL